jgi:hypothetical protein
MPDKRPEDMHTRDMVCPACNAQPGKPCTQSTNNNRVPVRWYHLARIEALAELRYQTTDSTRKGTE